MNYYEIFCNQFFSTLGQVSALAISSTIAIPLYNFYVRKNQTVNLASESNLENYSIDENCSINENYSDSVNENCSVDDKTDISDATNVSSSVNSNLSNQID